MVSPKPKIYWEASPFVAHIGNEAGRAHICRAVLNSARARDLDLYTSALSLVEVFKVPNSQSDDDAEKTIVQFFKNSWIIIQSLDRHVATETRRVERQFPHLKGPDAIHLGTAIYLGVDFLHTYDKDLLKCDGQVPGLSIVEPSLRGTTLPMDLS